MISNNNFIFQPFKIALGSILGLATFSYVASAANISALNPCPSIYYEEPHNHTRLSPQGCPPNAAATLRAEQGAVPISPTGRFVNQVLPDQMLGQERQQPTMRTIVLRAGQVNIKMRNMTSTPITYQAIGHTEQRSLMAGEEVMLQNLPAPVSITFLRPDSGLIKVMSVETFEPGSLELMFNEGMNLSDSQNTVRVQMDGKVVAF